MIVEPKVREFICLTAHPLGCLEHVKQQITYTKKQGSFSGPKRALIIGASTGYGLATRIALAFGCNAKTIGIQFEKEAYGKRTATAGFYNTKAVEAFAKEDGLYAASINGDAFSQKIKEEAIALIKKDLGTVDMVIYSLASPKRTAPDGITYTSALKTTDKEFQNKTLDLRKNEVALATIASATQEEIDSTIKVMGGEDWLLWMEALSACGVLSEHCLTLAYSYIGPEVTYPIYYKGTLGMAKKHLYDTAAEITSRFQQQGVQAYISVNKALVTQASSAIPIVPLYISILYKIMKEENLHEGCIEQMNRLLREKLKDGIVITDNEGKIRLDDYELRPNIQAKVMKNWEEITTQSMNELSDVKGYWEDFYHMFGFRFDTVDYSKDVEV